MPGPSRRWKSTSRLRPSAQAIRGRSASRNVEPRWLWNDGLNVALMRAYRRWFRDAAAGHAGGLGPCGEERVGAARGDAGQLMNRMKGGAMPKHRTIIAAALFAAGVMLGGLAAMPQARAAEKPNILLILVDNLGYGELGVYGGGATRGAP